MHEKMSLKGNRNHQKKKISNLKDRTLGIIHPGKHNEKRIKKSEERLMGLNEKKQYSHYRNPKKRREVKRSSKYI